MECRFIKLIVPMVLLLSCGSGRQSFLSQEEIDWLDDHEGTIEVLFGYQLPPEAFTNELGQYTGLQVDYLREIERILDFTFPMKFFPSWSDMLGYARDGEDFIIVGIADTPGRRRYLSFTRPMIIYNYAIVSKAENGFGELDDLAGRRVSTVKGYSIEEYLHGIDMDLSLSGLVNDLQVVESVASGDTDAGILGAMVANYFINSEGLDGLVLREIGEGRYSNSIAVPGGNDMLRGIMDKAVQQISPQVHKELNNRWNGLYTRRISRQFWNVLFASLVILVLLSLTTLAWLLTLRREVKKKTAEIRKSGERYQSLAENRDTILRSMAAGVAVQDGTGRIVEINPAMERLCGRRGGELSPDEELTDLIPLTREEERIELRALARRILESGEAEGLPEALSARDGEGTELLISVTGAPLTSPHEGRPGVVWILRDVSEHIRSERELLEADKSESLKVLAGGITHDFNNLLTGIYGFVNLSYQSRESSERVEEYLDKAMTSLEDARSLTAQLSAFARGNPEKRESFSPSLYFRETAEFAHRNKGIRMSLDLPDNLWPLRADRGQLGQVLSNLIINAEQAMGSRGELKVGAENLEDGGKRFVLFHVQDNGPGIPAENRRRIFDPYFTTKESGNGLGLASCAAVISRHGGRIDVESEPGKTVFSVVLPASASPD